ncbi:MAG: hypothetical protein HYX24_04030, partial [Candidatus Aenigmarchaeota archaeon]|nr:hypothetical protein [Candidatus Aenigmarchaeota archaeon]
MTSGVLGIARGGTNAGSFSSGSVVFANSTALTQNNGQFFWDNTNIRLGLNTSSPLAMLHINTSSINGALRIDNSTTGNTLLFLNATTGNVGIGVANPSVRLNVSGTIATDSQFV